MVSFFCSWLLMVFLWLPCGSFTVFLCFLLFMGFPMVSLMAASWLSYGLIWFLMVSLGFLGLFYYGFPMVVGYGFLLVFFMVPYGILMVSVWFSNGSLKACYCFPMFFLLVFLGFLVNPSWFSYGFLLLFSWSFCGFPVVPHMVSS